MKRAQVLICLRIVCVPSVPAPQLALVEPDLDSGGTQCLADLLGSLRIL